MSEQEERERMIRMIRQVEYDLFGAIPPEAKEPTLRNMYYCVRNDELKCWDFIPRGDYHRGRVSFSECPTEEDAWIATYLNHKHCKEQKQDSL